MDFRVGYRFVGEVGLFQELVSPDKMTEDYYNKTRNLSENVINYI
jgi:hypothetical protein